MLIGLLLILALPVAAQRKVKFGIFDKATEQPVIGAVITYADNEKLKSPQRVVTNMDGEATISVPQSDKCYYQVVSVGYNPLNQIQKVFMKVMMWSLKYGEVLQKL